MTDDYQWPTDAYCSGHETPTLWDSFVEGERPEERAARHERAKTLCRTRCPVRLECLNAVDPLRDDGIRGGVLLKSLQGRPFGYGDVQGIARAKWKRKAS